MGKHKKNKKSRQHPEKPAPRGATSRQEQPRITNQMPSQPPVQPGPQSDTSASAGAIAPPASATLQSTPPPEANQAASASPTSRGGEGGGLDTQKKVTSVVKSTDHPPKGSSQQGGSSPQPSDANTSSLTTVSDPRDTKKDQSHHTGGAIPKRRMDSKQMPSGLSASSASKAFEKPKSLSSSQFPRGGGRGSHTANQKKITSVVKSTDHPPEGSSQQGRSFPQPSSANTSSLTPVSEDLGLQIIEYFENLDKKKKERFINMIYLIVEIGSEVLQDTLRWAVTEQNQTVVEYLSDNKHKLFHATFGDLKCCVKNCMDSTPKMKQDTNYFYKLFHKERSVCTFLSGYKCICCLEPNSNPVLCEWDITLTCFLFCNCTPQRVNDITNIVKLRACRNSIFHRGSMEEIKKLNWQDISHAILEIAKYPSKWFYNKWEETIRKQEKNPPSSTDFKEWILKQKETEGELLKMMSDILTKLEANYKFPPEMKRIIDMAEAVLEDHKRNLYIEPRKALKHSLEHLQRNKAIFIVGNIGSGKTRFCLQLMTKFLQEHRNHTPLVITESSQWDQIIWDKEYVIFIDDIVGKSNLDSGAFNSWERKFDLPPFNSDSVYIITALRNCILESTNDNFKNYKLFNLHNRVNLSGSKFGLTPEEKLEMLETFCEFHNIHVDKSSKDEMNISQEELKRIGHMNLKLEFHYLCDLFFSNKVYLGMGSSFFENSFADFVYQLNLDNINMFVHFLIYLAQHGQIRQRR